MPHEWKHLVGQAVTEVLRLSRALRDAERQLADVKVSRERWKVKAEASNLIVRCTGCASPVPWPDWVTEEHVRAVEQLAQRLRAWWENRRMRMQEAPK